MKRLTGMDATFLYLETPATHMHVAGTYVYDPSDVPGGLSFERVRDLIEERLHLLPPYRQRLVSVPFQLHHPLWIEDPDFDLDYHLRRAARSVNCVSTKTRARASSSVCTSGSVRSRSFRTMAWTRSTVASS